METTITPALQNRTAADYDGLAQLYDRYWRSFSSKLVPALDALVLRFLPRGAPVLDLCCGTGQLAAALCRRGFDVTGIDGSDDMIRFARQNAPRASFIVADARGFDLRTRFGGVVSTGDSMNHMLTADDLALVFRNVAAALTEGGRFVFDMNMSEAFVTQWHKSSTLVDDDHLLYVHGKYEQNQRLGTTQITMFSLDGGWKRSDFTLAQRCYSRREVISVLLDSGFRDASAYPAKSFGIRGRISVGRTFFLARR